MSEIVSVDECLEAGTLLAGRYLVEFVLGRGGMGAVYFARDQAHMAEPLAVKELRMNCIPSLQEEAVKQFHQEASFLYHLEHPSLVKVRDFFLDNGRYYLTMNYVRGKTLAEMLRSQKQPFEIREVIGWTRQLLDVLDYLHSQTPPILFRDLKPGNVMVDPEGKLHLIDFGIARCLVDGSRTATILQGVGSPDYCPLEQYQGGGTDQRSDLYGLGATLYHLLTLKPPPLASEVALSGRPVPSPRRINPLILSPLEDLIIRLLALRKDDRYANVAQVRGALIKVESAYDRPKGSQAVVAEKPPASARAKRTNGSPQGLLLGGLTLLVVGLLVWLILQMKSH